jgi:hypothetical protein
MALQTTDRALLTFELTVSGQSNQAQLRVESHDNAASQHWRLRAHSQLN